MKKLTGSLLAFFALYAVPLTAQQESMNDLINRALEVATAQALSMAEVLEPQAGRLPKSVKEGALETSNCYWWCSGFFPGELWYLYENNPTPQLKQYATLFTERVRDVQYVTDNHDVGFMLFCSFGNGNRLLPQCNYDTVLINGARSLITRYSPVTQTIRSWDFTNNGKWQYPVIIDNMMNLELLTWASRKTGDSIFSSIAQTHADQTIQHHFRDDFSSYHVVSYDTVQGGPHLKATHQGFADQSAWARGQAWGLYGFTMMARETGRADYLDQARQIAAYLMHHPAMPADKVPYWDFNAPDIPDAVRDASAAAIMASALIELSRLDQSAASDDYLAYAEAQLRALSSPDYLAEPGTNANFLLKHSTGHYLANSEVDVPLSYADYYYVEALMRMKALLQAEE